MADITVSQPSVQHQPLSERSVSPSSARLRGLSSLLSTPKRPSTAPSNNSQSTLQSNVDLDVRVERPDAQSFTASFSHRPSTSSPRKPSTDSSLTARTAPSSKPRPEDDSSSTSASAHPASPRMRGHFRSASSHIKRKLHSAGRRRPSADMRDSSASLNDGERPSTSSATLSAPSPSRHEQPPPQTSVNRMLSNIRSPSIRRKPSKVDQVVLPSRSSSSSANRRPSTAVATVDTPDSPQHIDFQSISADDKESLDDSASWNPRLSQQPTGRQARNERPASILSTRSFSSLLMPSSWHLTKRGSTGSTASSSRNSSLYTDPPSDASIVEAKVSYKVPARAVPLSARTSKASLLTETSTTTAPALSERVPSSHNVPTLHSISSAEPLSKSTPAEFYSNVNNEALVLKDDLFDKDIVEWLAGRGSPDAPYTRVDNRKQRPSTAKSSTELGKSFFDWPKTSPQIHRQVSTSTLDQPALPMRRNQSPRPKLSSSTLDRGMDSARLNQSNKETHSNSAAQRINPNMWKSISINASDEMKRYKNEIVLNDDVQRDEEKDQETRVRKSSLNDNHVSSPAVS